jgi:hypothetical protein
LADCQKRVVKYWHESIVPEFSTGSRVLFVAHANTIRALVAFLDDTSPENIPHIHIPNSVPCVYHIDPATGNAMESYSKFEGASKGHWLLSTDNQQRLLNKLGGNSVGFARSVFDAWDTNDDGVLSKEELIAGMSLWKRDKDRALAALAGKLWEEVRKIGMDPHVHNIRCRQLKRASLIMCFDASSTTMITLNRLQLVNFNHTQL